MLDHQILLCSFVSLGLWSILRDVITSGVILNKIVVTHNPLQRTMQSDDMNHTGYSLIKNMAFEALRTCVEVVSSSPFFI